LLDLAGETIRKVLPVSAKRLRVFRVIPGCRAGATTGRAAASEVDAPGPGNGPDGYRTEHNGTPDQNAGGGGLAPARSGIPRWRRCRGHWRSKGYASGGCFECSSQQELDRRRSVM